MERSWQWMDLIYTETIREWKWAPNYARSDSFTVYAEVPILVEDMNFIKYIAHISEDQQKLLSVHEYVFLEGLRTGNAPKNGKADIQKLLDMWLIEGIGNTRWKRWILSQKYHEDHHILGKYTEVKWLERDEYKAMILKHIKENGRWFKKDIIFHNKTPRWVSNILTELKKDWKIIFRWPSKWGYWISNEINQK